MLGPAPQREPSTPAGARLQGPKLSIFAGMARSFRVALIHAWASVAAWRCPGVAVMRPADVRDGDDAAVAGWLDFTGGRNARLATDQRTRAFSVGAGTSRQHRFAAEAPRRLRMLRSPDTIARESAGVTH